MFFEIVQNKKRTLIDLRIIRSVECKDHIVSIFGQIGNENYTFVFPFDSNERATEIYDKLSNRLVWKGMK